MIRALPVSELQVTPLNSFGSVSAWMIISPSRALTSLCTITQFKKSWRGQCTRGCRGFVPQRLVVWSGVEPLSSALSFVRRAFVVRRRLCLSGVQEEKRSFVGQGGMLLFRIAAALPLPNWRRRASHAVTTKTVELEGALRHMLCDWGRFSTHSM